MELRQLEYFLELCRVRSFTKAAESLMVSQPSITKAIRQLEEELGVTLFDRSQKPITITPRGMFFYERVRTILQDLNAVAHEVSQAPAEHLYTVNIGLSPWTGCVMKDMLMDPEWGPPPPMLFNLVERAGPEIISMLEEEQLNIGFLIREDLPRTLDFLPLETQEVYCVLPESSPLTRYERLTFPQLSGENFAMDLESPDNSSLTKLVSRQCRASGYLPHVSVSLKRYLPNQHVAQSLVQNGYGIMFAPVHGARTFRNLAIRPMDPPLTMEVGLCWKSRRVRSPEEQALADYLCTAYPRYLQHIDQPKSAAE